MYSKPVDQLTFDGVVPSALLGRTSASGLWGGRRTFERGRTYLVEAASGTGKSSLCAYVYGYRNDYSGRILFDGTDSAKLGKAAWRRLRLTSLSLMFQELRLFGELTAIENVRLKNNLTHHKNDNDIHTLFDRLGIADKEDTPVSLMSYGQQQRVAFIRALCQPFDFLFMDEPVSHLDDSNATMLADILAEELDARGACAVVTSVGRKMKFDFDESITL